MAQTSAPRVPDHGNRLFIGNVNLPITEDELMSMFEPFGAVRNVHLAKDQETGCFRGVAFVEMADEEGSARAIEGLNGRVVGGRRLAVGLGF